MNGRMYDARLGRFLSPDNYVQAPYNTQSYNRYSYAFNNPLVYVDPDGELAWFIPLIIGAAINVASNWDHIASADNFWQGLGRAAGYAAVGAASGAATLIGGPLGFAASGAISGLGNGLLRGQSGTELLANVGIGATAGLLGGMAIGSFRCHWSRFKKHS